MFQFGFPSLHSLGENLFQEGNAPAATGAGAAALGQLAGHARARAAHEVHQLATAHVKTITNLGIEFHASIIPTGWTTMNLDLILRPPLTTADVPGIGGRIKVEPEDFRVEEIPAYLPCGTGEFLYLWIEKRDMGAEYFQRQVARRLGIGAGEVGTAGLKDRRAVTRQWLSVPAAVEERLKDLEGDGLRVLEVCRHGNKLRPGHLHGNRFEILIRDTTLQGSVEEVLKAWSDRLGREGLPNYYGAQRFGRDAETLRMGRSLLGMEEDLTGSARPRPPRNPFLRKLALSSVQSALFNLYLARRLQDGLFRTVLAGDVLAKVPRGGMFVARDVAAEQDRFDRREIVHAGPIFGRKTMPAEGIAAEREQALLADWHLTPRSFAGFGKLMMGTRRHDIVYPEDLHVEASADGVRLRFTLSAGSYATVLLRELMKNEGADDEENLDDTAGDDRG